MILFRVVMLASLILGEAFAQTQPQTQSKDPFRVAPQAYKFEFENEWVRVTRVRYGPREKIPEHYHTERPSAYVYLNDAGPIIFKHVDLPYGDVKRAAVKAGTFRLYHAVKEVHAVENPTDVPSEFLRVEFKTEPLNQNSLNGKFHREPFAPDENWMKVQFENEQIRIARMVIAPHKKMDVSTNATQPALLVALTPSQLQESGSKGTDRINLELGKTRWLDIDKKEALENAGDTPVELLRFEFKTKPFNDPSDRTDVHDQKRSS